MEQPGTDDTDAIAVGRVLGTHGTTGQVRVKVFSDVPQRFDPGQLLYCNHRPLHIIDSAPNPRNQVTLKFQDIDSPAAAQDLVGHWLTVPAESGPPPLEGEYFHYQLLGLRVLTDQGEELGEVAEILETGSNDVYIVEGASGQLLIPAIADVVRQVDLERGVMTVKLMEGLR